jgi:hypothetical protein
LDELARPGDVIRTTRSRQLIRYYLDPASFRFTSLFPYIDLPDPPSGVFDGEPTANVVLSMPLLVVLMVFGWIFERSAADFMPLLVLGVMIGLVDLWNRLDARSRTSRTFVLVVAASLAWFGFWANTACAITPWSTWNSVQASNFVNVEREVSDVTGHPLDHKVVVGKSFPDPAAMGTLFVEGRCRALYLAYVSVHPTLTPAIWYLPVERSPHVSLCHALVGKR